MLLPMYISSFKFLPDNQIQSKFINGEINNEKIRSGNLNSQRIDAVIEEISYDKQSINLDSLQRGRAQGQSSDKIGEDL